ncbi:MAG: hypothetical protein MUF01_18860 [Bryobacterales bacterium]|jgi:hypothetical protein|nr:hypothetical protein [Bryobacterales bacterium]
MPKQRTGGHTQHATAEATPSSPDGAAAQDLHALWVANTRTCLDQLAPKRDGRLRSRGAGLLDLCVSPERAKEALTLVEGWLPAIHAAGFQLEMRPLDGWRVCVVSGSAVLPIRVRERMRPQNELHGANFRLEQLLGGKRGQSLTPSGELELQILRHGVCAGAFPVDLDAPAVAYQQSMAFLQDLQQRELAWQGKSRRRAEHRRLADTPRSYRAVPPEPVRESLPLQALQAPEAAVGLEPVSDLARVAFLLQELDLTLKRVHPKSAEHLRMRSSLSRLAHACQLPPENAIGRDLSRLHGLLQGLEAQQDANRPYLTARKRVVA